MAAMMRSLSSCLDATRTGQDRACEVGEEPFDKVEPGTVLGREGEFEAVGRLLRDPGSGRFGNVRGMIVEDQLDRSARRIGGVEKLKASGIPADRAIPRPLPTRHHGRLCGRLLLGGREALGMTANSAAIGSAVVG